MLWIRDSRPLFLPNFLRDGVLSRWPRSRSLPLPCTKALFGCECTQKLLSMGVENIEQSLYISVVVCHSGYVTCHMSQGRSTHTTSALWSRNEISFVRLLETQMRIQQET